MPWVPRDLYDEMLAALRASRAPVAVAVSAAPEPVPAEPVPAPIMLSPAVYDACVRFAFGDPNEKAANLRIAKSLMRDKVSDSEIVQAIKSGAMPVTL